MDTLICINCKTDKALYQCAAKCKNVVYCGVECAKQHWSVHKVNCNHITGVIMCSSVKFGRVVVTPTGFVMLKMIDMDESQLFDIAKQYVDEHNLKWKIRKPHSWTDYKAGPHVTLEKSMASFQGEIVKVDLGDLFHFITESKWVAMHVTLPSKFKCPYNDCHISIAQQRL